MQALVIWRPLVEDELVERMITASAVEVIEFDEVYAVV
jgi:hypothetical protein